MRALDLSPSGGVPDELANIAEHLRVMQRQMASLHAQLSRLTGPLKPLFLAGPADADATLWKEKTVANGQVVEFPDGRRNNDAADERQKILSPGAAYPVMEVEDIDDAGNRLMRYVRIGGNVALVRVTGSEPGGGKYTGVIVPAPAADVDVPPAGDLTSHELGHPPSGLVLKAVRIVNTREVGQPTHDLTGADDAYLPVDFLGVFLKTADDGVDVYAVDGMQWEDCVSETQIVVEAP